LAFAESTYRADARVHEHVLRTAAKLASEPHVPTELFERLLGLMELATANGPSQLSAALQPLAVSLLVDVFRSTLINPPAATCVAAFHLLTALSSHPTPAVRLACLSALLRLRSSPSFRIRLYEGPGSRAFIESLHIYSRYVAHELSETKQQGQEQIAQADSHEKAGLIGVISIPVLLNALLHRLQVSSALMFCMLCPIPLQSPRLSLHLTQNGFHFRLSRMRRLAMFCFAALQR
jgi:hypothetical protein